MLDEINVKNMVFLKDFTTKIKGYLFNVSEPLFNTCNHIILFIFYYQTKFDETKEKKKKRKNHG